MSEIEQLRQDIDQAKEIMFRFYKQDRQALGLGEMYDRLAKLEAEAAAKADPWAKAVDIIYGWTKIVGQEHGDERLIVAKYVVHLESQVMDLKHDCNEAKSQLLGSFLKTGIAENKVAVLEAELANRPVADPEPTKWGGKADGKWVVDGFGKPLRFYSREAAKYVFSDAVEIVPYTEEQS